MILTLVSGFLSSTLAPLAAPEMHKGCTALNEPELWVQEEAAPPPRNLSPAICPHPRQASLSTVFFLKATPPKYFYWSQMKNNITPTSSKTT